MREKMLRFAPLILLAFLLTGCGYAGPEKAVRQEMELIRKLDEPAIKAFVSYEDIRLSHSAPLEIGEETTEAVKLFFKNFSYRIRSSAVSEDGASATVEMYVTNLDAQMLARDLCRAMIDVSVTQEGSETPEGLASSFALMKTCLEENTYPLVTLPVTVNLVNQNGAWVIQESVELEDALAGGLVTYLRDPYLLTPREVLECTLKPFKKFSAQEWKNYLNLNDVFSTGSELASDLDTIVAGQIETFFDYSILDVTQDGDQASADITVRSLDLQDIINNCRSRLLEYAGTTESIRATDEQIAAKAASFLLDALRSNTKSASLTITIPMQNDGHTWEVLPNQDFADALLGGVNLASELLYPDAETDAPKSSAQTDGETEIGF